MKQLNTKKMTRLFSMLFCMLLLSSVIVKSQSKPAFKVIAFYTAKNDAAHISFVHEANDWFPRMAAKHNFQYDSTNDWSNLNESFLAAYQVVIFLDTRPDSLDQRIAFERYMKNGGGWIGFHFAGFALTPSAFPQNWDWYHDEFLGAGAYASNTWRPTPAVLKVENLQHQLTRAMPSTFRSSANEWYRWKNDLRKNPNIDVLVSIDPSSFPLGTGPKQHEIWHSGDYPVVWTNKQYNMLYLNMGHNDIDYEGGTKKALSFTFNNPVQDQLVVNALLWMGKKTK